MNVEEVLSLLSSQLQLCSHCICTAGSSAIAAFAAAVLLCTAVWVNAEMEVLIKKLRWRDSKEEPDKQVFTHELSYRLLLVSLFLKSRLHRSLHVVWWATGGAKGDKIVFHTQLIGSGLVECSPDVGGRTSNSPAQSGTGSRLLGLLPGSPPSPNDTFYLHQSKLEYHICPWSTICIF